MEARLIGQRIVFEVPLHQLVVELLDQKLMFKTYTSILRDLMESWSSEPCFIGTKQDSEVNFLLFEVFCPIIGYHR